MGGYMDAEFKFCCSVAVAVLHLLCICRVPTVLAQSSQSAFLNIDCGATATYIDSVTGFTWVPDAAYINSTGKVTPKPLALPPLLQNFTQMKTLRYFDDVRPKKFCYALPVIAKTAYLLQASFFYGNYDNKNQPPSFQFAIDATILENVTTDTYDAFDTEHHYVSQGSVSYVCLIRTSPSSTPFISGISLKPATALTSGHEEEYNTYLQQGSFVTTLTRVNYGATELIRAPDDFYDRLWFPEDEESNAYYLKSSISPYEFLSTTSVFENLVDTQIYPPSAVMQTAVTSNGTLAALLLPPGLTDTGTDTHYVTVYIGELLNSSGILRNFTVEALDTTISVDLAMFPNGTFADFWSPNAPGPNSTVTMTNLATSRTGPILNAMEVFAVSDPRVSKTLDQDALAIENIKKSLNLTEWTGDPCLPFPHPWVTCKSPDVSTIQPMIIAVNLSGYELEGTIPASFAKLVDLTSLILDNNNLRGPLPGWLITLTQLEVLSIQNNNFSGPIPDALLSANSRINFTYMPGNPLLVCGSNCHGNGNGNGKSNIAVIVGAGIGGIVGLILILLLAIVAYLRCQRKVPHRSDDEGTHMMRIATKGGAKAYSLTDVKAATNHFNRELGKGGFGPVYYGTLPDGQEVAVKVADGSSKQGAKEFFNEVDVLSRVHHKNLVALVGYCQEQKPILIYEYMHNGSLFDHLHGISASAGNLDWRMRLHIALNAAQGLEYLHTGCSPSFIHRDVKSGNILLTPKFDAKVADFGLTKLMGEAEDTSVMTDVMGTAGYLDPEYYTTQYLSSKSDVYSFGIVLLELITGRLPINHSAITEGKKPHIVHWVRESLQNNDIDSILDPAVKASKFNIEAVWKVADIAMQSVEPSGVHRPTMSEVVQELQGALTIEGISMPSALSSQSEFSDNSSRSQRGLSTYPMAR